MKDYCWLRHVLGGLFCLLLVCCDASVDNPPVVIEADTQFGKLLFNLYPSLAPQHVEQVSALAQQGAYNGSKFRTILPEFIAEIGELPQKSDQAALPTIPFEPNTLLHKKGWLTMSRARHDYDSASASFSVLLADAKHLDGQYTVFGRLQAGEDILKEIVAEHLKNINAPDAIRIRHMKVLAPESAPQASSFGAIGLEELAAGLWVFFLLLAWLNFGRQKLPA